MSSRIELGILVFFAENKGGVQFRHIFSVGIVKRGVVYFHSKSLQWAERYLYVIVAGKFSNSDID